MKTFGFKVNNNTFEKSSWYFRNALVRANYNDLHNGVYETTKFGEIFFSNLILGTKYELKNRFSTVKRIMESLQKKQYIRRVGGKKYGRREVLM